MYRSHPDIYKIYLFTFTMQQIIITGNLVADAQLKTKKNNGEPDTEFITFKVASNNRIGEVTETTYYDVSYRKTRVFDYLKKGQSVLVSGSLRHTVSTGEDGNKYFNLQIYNATVELTGKKTESN